MKCDWCEKESDNEPEESMNVRLEKILVVYCDNCKKAQKEASEIIKTLKGDKGEDFGRAERLSELDYIVGDNDMVCESLNTTNK